MTPAQIMRAVKRAQDYYGYPNADQVLLSVPIKRGMAGSKKDAVEYLIREAERSDDPPSPADVADFREATEDMNQLDALFPAGSADRENIDAALILRGGWGHYYIKPITVSTSALQWSRAGGIDLTTGEFWNATAENIREEAARNEYNHDTYTPRRYF